MEVKKNGQLVVGPVTLGLAGRREELTTLRDLLGRAMQGEGSTVVLEGEAGIGKTALLSASREMASQAGALTWMDRKGGEPDVPLGPFGGAIAHYIRKLPADERGAVEGSFRRIAPALATVVLGGAAGDIPEEEDASEIARSRQFHKLAELLLLLSQRTSLLIGIEDLHRADSVSIQFLYYLATKIRTAPILLVATVRSDALSSSDEGMADVRAILEELGREEHLTRIPVSRLSKKAVGDLIRRRLSPCELDGLVERVYRQTEGVPLFVEQQVDLLKETGIVVRQRGIWMATPEADELSLPATVRETIETRVSGLDPLDREVLSHAAVQGLAFSTSVLSGTLRWPKGKVLRQLSALERRRGIVVRSEDGYAFAHGLVQQALLEGWGEEVRRNLHLKVGEILEREACEKAGRTEPGVLGYHFYEGGAPARAVPYLVRAGSQSKRLFAFREAKRYFLRALKAFDRMEAAPGGGLSVLLELSETHELLGQWREAFERCVEVLERADPTTDQEAIGEALIEMGLIRAKKAEWEEALGYYQRGLDLFTKLGKKYQQALVFNRLGMVAFERGSFDEASGYYNQALNLARAVDDRKLLAGIHGNLGCVCAAQGNAMAAVLSYTKSVQIYEKLGDQYGLALAHHNLGMTYASQEDWEKTVASYARSERLAREMGARDLLGMVLLNTAMAWGRLGKAEKAQQACDTARNLIDERKDWLGIAECNKVEGALARHRGEWDRAERLLHGSLSMFEELENRLGVAEVKEELGMLRLLEECDEKARTWWTESAALFEEVGAAQEARRVKQALDGLSVGA